MTELTRRGALAAAGAAGAGLLGVQASVVAQEDGDGTTTGGGTTAAGTTADGDGDGDVVATWAASMQEAGNGFSNSGLEDQTLRQVVHTSLGGSELQVRLANTFGEQSLVVDTVTVGVRDQGAAVVEDTVTEATFDGSAGTEVPAGERATSDPVSIEVEATQDVVVSFYAPEATGPASWQQLGKDQSYATDGDEAATAGGDAFSSNPGESYYFLDGLDLVAPESEGTIVCFGDSITNGAESTIGEHETYPDHLASRIADSDAIQKSVVNAGINGNRLLNDSIEGQNFGESGLSRFDRDALAQSGVTDVILLEGTNDIIHGEADWWDAEDVTPQQLKDGMTEIVDRCHAADVRAIGGTIPPFGEYDLYSETAESKRTSVNEWIRDSDTFDAVIDFAMSLQDPTDSTVMAGQYSADGLHPNDQGYHAMAVGFQLDALVEGDLETSTPTTTAPTTTAPTATGSGTTSGSGGATTADDGNGGDGNGGDGDSGGGGGPIPGFGVPAAIAGLGAGAAAASGLLRDAPGDE